MSGWLPSCFGPKTNSDFGLKVVPEVRCSTSHTHNMDSMMIWSVHALLTHESWPNHMVKLRCYWERLGEQLENLGNPMKRWWEHVANTLGTRNKKQKKKTPPKGKKTGPIMSNMLSLLIGCMKFLFPKLLVTIFDLG
jgi:hypothetical protein